MAIYKNSELAK